MTSTGSRAFGSNSEQTNLWHLPEILNIEARRAHYEPPKQFWVNRQILEVKDGIELLVQLSAPLPSRAMTPSLYVGETPVSDYELAGPNLYRFFVINPDALQANAPIALGWPQLPEQKLATSNFRFQVRTTGLA